MAKSPGIQATRDSPRAAASYVRSCSGAVLEGRRVGHREFAAQRNCLVRWFENQGRLLGRDCCRQYRRVSEGAEHVVYFDADNGRAVKVTHPNRFGHSVVAEGHDASPLEYLRRLTFHNLLFGDDVRLLGCIFTGSHIELVTTQPWISAGNPPTASQAQIDSYFEERRFARSSLFDQLPVYYSTGFDLVAMDAHPGNVLVSDKGFIMPIDVVVGVPGPEFRARLRREQGLRS